MGGRLPWRVYHQILIGDVVIVVVVVGIVGGEWVFGAQRVLHTVTWALASPLGRWAHVARLLLRALFLRAPLPLAGLNGLLTSLQIAVGKWADKLEIVVADLPDESEVKK